MSDEIQRELGEISSTLKHIKETQGDQGKTLVKIDDRLREVEKRAALNGLVTGGVTGGVMAVAVSFIKSKLTGGS